MHFHLLADAELVAYVDAMLSEKGSVGHARESNDDGRTPVYVAAALGHTEVVKVLATIGADCNAREKEHGFTPLHAAAEKGHIAIARLLFDLGFADMEATDATGKTAVHIAVVAGHRVMAACLVKVGRKYR